MMLYTVNREGMDVGDSSWVFLVKELERIDRRDDQSLGNPALVEVKVGNLVERTVLAYLRYKCRWCATNTCSLTTKATCSWMGRR